MADAARFRAPHFSALALTYIYLPHHYRKTHGGAMKVVVPATPAAYYQRQVIRRCEYESTHVDTELSAADDYAMPRREQQRAASDAATPTTADGMPAAS